MLAKIIYIHSYLVNLQHCMDYGEAKAPKRNIYTHTHRCVYIYALHRSDVSLQFDHVSLLCLHSRYPHI